jgi:tripeptide aminopeptidase
VTPDVTQRLLDLAVRVQRIPAPSFNEAQRAGFVRDRFVEEGLSDVALDAQGNVRARLKGSGGGAPLVVSAHLDTVFPEGTSLKIIRRADRIIGPGIGDNSLGISALFGLLWMLRARSVTLPGDVWLVADVCEEGLGDLRGMRAVVDHFGAAPRCYLVLEGLALGHVYQRAVGVRRYRITVRTSGGHAWSDYGQPSAIHVLGELITQLGALKLPLSPRTTLNAGRIAGGTSINTIAAEAWLELDMRSEGSKELETLVAQAEEITRRCTRSDTDISFELIGSRPAGELPVDHPFVRLAEACLREQGIEPILTSGSTDANVPLSLGYPALVLGITTGGGAHTVNEFIFTEPVAKGMEQVLQFVKKVWE